MRRYVIIGGGVASIAALEAIRRVDAQGSITLIGDEPHGFYSRPGLAYYLTGELAEQNLFPLSKQDFRKLNVHWVQAHVTGIHAQRYTVQLQNGSLIPYDRLLIATGASAQRAKTPGSHLEGVLKLDNLDDARIFIESARRNRTAVVIGGGITALEIVEGLVARQVKTHYFLRGDRFWSNVLDETESRIVEHRLKEEGVSIQYNTQLEEIFGSNNKVNGVRTKDGRTIHCQMVAIAIGIQPRNELAENCGIKVDRGVLVSETLQTSAEDIFAAGDIAQVFDPLTGKSVLDSLWGPARDQGNAAGLNMAGITTVYRKRAAFNVTRLANLTTTIIGAVGNGEDEDVVGIVRGDSETWREPPDAIAAQANFAVNRLRLMVGSSTLQGALVMGDQTLSPLLQRLVIDQVDIRPIRSLLLQPDPALAEIIANFWAKRINRHATPTH
jgi:NAD(P)H-nitrite reductase large subunit